MNPKRIVLVGVAISALVFSTGCCCTKKTTVATQTSAATAPPVVASQTVAAPAPASAPTAIRIKAGLETSLTNSDGTVWLPDQDFADGETIDRPDAQVDNTKEPAIYQSERYSMTSFSRSVPNGKYIVKLHFAETYEGVTGPGQRIFSFNVEGHEFKDFDVFAKAGGANRAYVETVPVEVTDGKLDITFTADVENPQINGIEIIPNP